MNFDRRHCLAPLHGQSLHGFGGASPNQAPFWLLFRRGAVP